MDNFEIFGLNSGKLTNYVRYFGSNIGEGVAESWVEAKMSWMEVDGAGWKWVHGLVIRVTIDSSCAFGIVILIMFISTKLAYFFILKEYLVHQQRYQFLASLLFDTKVNFNVKKEQ